MYDAGSMRPIQRIGNLNSVPQNIRKRQWISFQPALDGFAIQALHHQVVDPVFTADVMQRANVRVVEFGACAGLALEPLPDVFSLGRYTREHFKSDGPVEPCVFGPVDFSHTASTQRGQDHIRAKSVTGG
jgi:hypothetical protein